MAAEALQQLREPIAPSMVAAIGIHLLVIFGVGFNIDWPETHSNTIAVTVSLTPATVAPERARHVAADNQLGADDPGIQAKTQVRMQTALSISREMDAFGDKLSDPADLSDTRSDNTPFNDRWSAESDSSAQSNPLVGSVAARRALDAEYLARWRGRVEQVGNALYRGEPPAGNGDVRLLVSVLADGSLERVTVIKSSGSRTLDQAAQDTVVLAAPFPRFSVDLAKHTSRLQIVRTWQFRTETVGAAP